MKSYISTLLAAAVLAPSAFSEIIKVDLNTAPGTETGYYTGDYYFDLTNVTPDQEYYGFPHVNDWSAPTGDDASEDPVVAQPNDANALFEIGADSNIDLGFWEWFVVNSTTENSYVSNDEFTGIVWKFDVGSDGSTGSISTLKSEGTQNSQIQGMKLFDFSDFDTSKSVEFTQELFNMGTWSSFNSNSTWMALIDGEQCELAYNGTVTIETEDGTYVITLTEHSSLEEDPEYENRRWLDYEFSFASNVPEPSTYAAIFGALALGLAAYRRRK